MFWIAIGLVLGLAVNHFDRPRNAGSVASSDFQSNPSAQISEFAEQEKQVIELDLPPENS